MTAAEFGHLFNKWRPRFEAFAYRYVRSTAMVEDVVSDSFMAFWERRKHISADSNIQAYILTIVRNKCLDWLRSQSVHTKIEQKIFTLRQRVVAADIRSLQALNPGDLFSKEVEDILRRSLADLPDLTRNVFIERRIYELSHKEIGEKYGITARRVEFELSKAMKHLKVALKDYLPLVLLFLLSDIVS